MRNLVLLLTMALSMSAATASAAVDSAASASERLLGGDNPFPLICPQDFKLKSMEGVWELLNFHGGDAERYSAFAFETQIDCKNREILRIRRFNVVTGQILAEGVGYREDKRDVKALMRGAKGNTYMLFVGVYKNVDPTSKYPINFDYPILRIAPLDNPSGGKGYILQQMPLAKSPYVRTSSNLTCED